MKKNSIKKLIAIFISMIMIFAMGIISFAAQGSADGVTSVSGDTELSIKKTVRMENAEAGTYNQPDVTYTYTIEPADVPAGATVTGSGTGAGTINVDQGPANGVLIKTDDTPTYAATGTVVFTKADTYTTDSSGDANINYVLVNKNLDLHVDITKFSVPGVYRYKISDTTTADTLTEAGIVRKAADNGFATGNNKVQDEERYLDVYIENDTTGLKVAGYVLTSSNNSATDTTTKTEGFTNTDVYRTYNISITKKTTGALADKTHEFPFEVTISNKDGKDGSVQHQYYVAKNTDSLAAKDETTQNFVLKNQDIYYIKGLTPFATVAYEETNDTDDTYVVTANGFKTAADSNDKTTYIDAQSVVKSGTASIAANAVTNYTTRTSTASEAETTYMRSVVWENNFESISPTGIVRRYLPYMAMAVVAVLLMVGVIASRRRDEDLEEE